MKVIDKLREQEKDVTPQMYGCYRLGHFVDESGVCVCCLKQVAVKK